MNEREGREIIPEAAVPLWPGIVRVTARNPGMMTGPGTNTYLVGTVVIDPGPDDPVHLDAILSASTGPITAIAVTHAHIDHAPGAAALAKRTEAPVLGFAPSAGFLPDLLLTDGQVVDAGELHLRAVHTPGHASDHLCFLLVERPILFSGDHVMQGSTVVIAPPDGDMAAYLASLRLLAELDPPLERIAPGHGVVIADPAAAVGAYLAHREEREASIAKALATLGFARSGEIVDVVYTDVPAPLHPVARWTVWAHLRKLASDGRASASDLTDPDAVWHPT